MARHVERTWDVMHPFPTASEMRVYAACFTVQHVAKRLDCSSYKHDAGSEASFYPCFVLLLFTDT